MNGQNVYFVRKTKREHKSVVYDIIVSYGFGLRLDIKPTITFRNNYNNLKTENNNEKNKAKNKKKVINTTIKYI
ncbi:MAG: hypothetical protein FWH29_04245 [Methanobrevibacter sp.]|nr:hypothetical protein [Methanobrevibacter sp.]